MFADSDHAGDKASCRSRSGFLIYVNSALVQRFSKKQSTVEISVFCPKFVTMKQGIDALRFEIQTQYDGNFYIWFII